MEKYFQIETSGTKATIYIYGDITDENYSESDVSALSFRNELAAIPLVSEIEVRVQSYGGSVFSGVAIYNMLKNYKAMVTVYIDGVACSIATVIAMAGDKVIMPSNSMMMIHNPMSSLSYGNSNELRKMADTLDKIRESSIEAYLSKSNGKITREKLIDLLDDETWLSAEECKNYGFCDEVTNQVELVAKFNDSTCINALKNNPIKLEEKKEVKNMTIKLNGNRLEDLKAQQEEFINEHKDCTHEQLLNDYPFYNSLVGKIEQAEIRKLEQKNEEDEQKLKMENVKEQQQHFYKDGKKVQVLSPEQKITVPNQSRYEQKEFSDMSIGKLVKGMATGKRDGAEKEQQVVAANRDGSGGVLIPTPLSNELINMVRAQSVLMTAGARTVPMTSSTLVFAKQTGDIKPHWKKEGEPIIQTDADFEPVKFEAKTLVGMSDITIELLEDALNIDQVVTQSIVNALALELDRVGLLGAGTEIEPKGIYNRDGIQKQVVGKALENYKEFSKAVTSILSANGTPNGVIYSPRTYGELDALTDVSGQPLNAPKSYENLTHKLTTTQVPNDLGAKNDGSFAVVGDFTKLWYGVLTGVTIEVTRVAGDAFSNLKFKIRAYLRADVQTI
ncbi:head maturation protease, ClpP-related [Enterococcus sp. HY326]|uniref:head maturation protease, ClpP-related n=1 Tax=Enterococcus sp. HY326 TaxID=2971265 RepID=UPI00223ED9FE|nr:head maturation protease, ClpP-related [Enterococcus sp. HY326]